MLTRCNTVLRNRQNEARREKAERGPIPTEQARKRAQGVTPCGDNCRRSREKLQTAARGEDPVRVVGCGGSPTRTLLCGKFPANREFYREFWQIDWAQSVGNARKCWFWPCPGLFRTESEQGTFIGTTWNFWTEAGNLKCKRPFLTRKRPFLAHLLATGRLRSDFHGELCRGGEGEWATGRSWGRRRSGRHSGGRIMRRGNAAT